MLSATASANKIYFFGGNVNGVSFSTIDIYDVTTYTFTTARLNEARSFCVSAAAGNKILITDDKMSSISKEVEIFDVTTNTSAITKLSDDGSKYAMAGIGNKVLFGGGFSANFNFLKTVHVYNGDTHSFSKSQLSEARDNLAAAATGSKVVFAGGAVLHGFSKTVDIFTLNK